MNYLFPVLGVAVILAGMGLWLSITNVADYRRIMYNDNNEMAKMGGAPSA